MKLKRESGENPLQPPLLCVRTNQQKPLDFWEGVDSRKIHKSGDLPKFRASEGGMYRIV